MCWAAPRPRPFSGSASPPPRPAASGSPRRSPHPSSGQPLSQMQIDRLSQLRRAYEELAEVYDAMRRLVERGYLAYTAPEKGG